MSHVFISYLREDQSVVDRLVDELALVGIDVWVDRQRLQPGQRWRITIREAIRSGACFIACFSPAYAARNRSYMNEELTIAIEELRLRPTDRTWFIPVTLAAIEIPERDIGAGQTLRDLQWADLSINWEIGVASIVRAVIASGAVPAEAPTVSEVALAQAVIRAQRSTIESLLQKLTTQEAILREHAHLINNAGFLEPEPEDESTDEVLVDEDYPTRGLEVNLAEMFRHIRGILKGRAG